MFRLFIAKGVEPNPVNIQAERDFRQPPNIAKVQSFLRLAG